MTTLSCFKAYDIRGRIPGELNEDLAYRIGQAYTGFIKPRRVAVGRGFDRQLLLEVIEALESGAGS